MNALIRYDEACKALAKAKSVDEAKSIKDKAEALRAFARIAKNRQLEIDAAEIRIRAERRLGELIAEQKKTVGLNPGTRLKGKTAGNIGGRVERPPIIPTLKDAGIDKDLSSHAQKLAAIRDEEFEVGLRNWRDFTLKDGKRVTLSLFKTVSRNGHHDVVEEDEEKERELTHAFFNISQLRPWDLGTAQNLLARYLRTVFRKWWLGDKEHLIDLLKTEASWMEQQMREK